jgi:hypothetical protein
VLLDFGGHVHPDLGAGVGGASVPPQAASRWLMA